MIGTRAPVPRGLSVRCAWLALSLYDRIKHLAETLPEAGGTMDIGGRPAAATESEPLPLSARGLTHTGRRGENEDRFLIREDLGIALVADGYGGTPGGALAAERAVEAVKACFDPEQEQTAPDVPCDPHVGGPAVAWLRFAFEHAGRAVVREGRRRGKPGMSCSLAAVVVAGPHVLVASAGCARVYRYRTERGDHRLTQLTPDLGAAPPFAFPIGLSAHEQSVRLRIDPWMQGDLYLLCTAGLHRVLGPELLRCTLAASPGVESVTALLGRALHAGGTHDMTAVLARPTRALSGL